MLNLQRTRDCRRFDRPFSFALIESPFADPDDARLLSREFPREGFECRTHGGGRFFRRPLFVLGTSTPYLPEQLGPKALALAELLVSPEYRDTLAEAMDIDLDGTQIEAWFWRYDAETVFVPHTDQPTKLVTQVFYLNEQWPWAAGGRLRILNAEDPENVAYEIAPNLELSTIIKRSDASWHLITPVTSAAPESRNTITVHMHRGATS
jgi:hypothetical protein